MSILVRPVREQLEHDRVIRLLLAKWKKELVAEANVGDERRTSVKVGQLTVFPDLVLNSPTGPRRLQGLVEVETGESVNNLEAMAQWTHMSRAKAPFYLYVPVGAVEQARRLCDDHQVSVGELWSYYVLGEQVRFTLVRRDHALAVAKGRSDGMADVIETEVLGPLESPAEETKAVEHAADAGVPASAEGAVAPAAAQPSAPKPKAAKKVPPAAPTPKAPKAAEPAKGAKAAAPQKAAGKKPAAKPAASKQAAVKKAVKKAAVKKAAVKKAVAKKATPKTAGGRAQAKRTAARKPAVKKVARAAKPVKKAGARPSVKATKRR